MKARLSLCVVLCLVLLHSTRAASTTTKAPTPKPLPKVATTTTATTATTATTTTTTTITTTTTTTTTTPTTRTTTAIPPTATVPTCDVSTLNLTDLEVWRREQGFWVGEYTFLGADGNPFVSSGWPYVYQPYKGFIHIQLNGNKLRQRNIFVYPPQKPEKCNAARNVSSPPDVLGAGTCGVNGNEKIFSADQAAANCNGDLAGKYPYFTYSFDTYTRVIGDDTVLYTVKLPAAFGGGFQQNQLTTLPGDRNGAGLGIRVRTAQGFDLQQRPNSVSFYRETRVSYEVWKSKLAETRAAYNVLPADYCARDGNNILSGVTCDEHFGFATL